MLWLVNNSACGVGSHGYFGIGSAEIDAHLSGTDSDGTHLNTPTAVLSVSIAAVPLTY